MDGMLSQDEINALLSGLTDTTEPEPIEDDISIINSSLYLSDEEKDVIGEVANICMGSAATALFSILNHRVNITTPKPYFLSSTKNHCFHLMSLRHRFIL